MRFPITLLLATGCVFPTAASDRDRDPAPQPAIVAAGSFVVISRVEIPAEAILPTPAADLVGSLRAFSAAPAHTLIDLAESAGVPAVATLRAVLPSALEAKLEGWIDAEIAKLSLDGKTIPQLADELVTYAETTLTQVNLESTMTIANGAVAHELVALDLAPTGLEVRFELGALPDEVTDATATATTSSTSSRATVLAIGDHQFSLAYGVHAWRALELTATRAYGAGVRQTLGAAVDCPLIAARVAAQCVVGLCVGHAAELTSICERGLDEVVDRARAKVIAMRFDALRLSAGTATLVDLDADGRADRLESGVWTAEINAGQGLRPAPATFTASR